MTTEEKCSGIHIVVKAFIALWPLNLTSKTAVWEDLTAYKMGFTSTTSPVKLILHRFSARPNDGREVPRRNRFTTPGIAIISPVSIISSLITSITNHPLGLACGQHSTGTSSFPYSRPTSSGFNWRLLPSTSSLPAPVNPCALGPDRLWSYRQHDAGE